jgi:pimeloyl-ACP methyl ester carboxylesterase
MSKTDSPEPNRPRRRWLRIFKRVLITIFVVMVVLVYGVMPYLFARLVTNAGTRPLDRDLSETPESLGATYQDVEFQTSDGVTIRGWLLPSTSQRITIIYSHGLFRSRRELLARAVELWRLGYGALLYDSRNHGLSGTAKVSLGYFERLDARAAVKFLLEDARSQDRIVMFGISMGAGAALLAAAETPDVTAVIADSPFLSFKDTTDHHVRVFLRLPAFPLANELRFFIERSAGFDGARLDVMEAVKQMGDRPALFVAAANDRRMPPDIARKLHDASLSPARDLLIVDGPNSDVHGHAYQAAPKLYIERIDQFLRSAVTSEPPER